MNREHAGLQLQGKELTWSMHPGQDFQLLCTEKTAELENCNLLSDYHEKASFSQYSPQFKWVKSFGAMVLTSSLRFPVFHLASTFKLHSVVALFNTAFVDKSRSKVPHAEPWVLNSRTSNTNNADQNRVPYPLRARRINRSTRTARE